jgi:hypothetical protein
MVRGNGGRALRDITGIGGASDEEIEIANKRSSSQRLRGSKEGEIRI